MQRNSFLLAMTAIVAFVLLSAACGGSDDGPEGAESPPVTARPAATVEWPSGGEVPEALSGLWYEALHPSKITLEGNDYTVVQPDEGAHGNVVVNGDEIDFFNGDVCGMRLPRGVGKYRWELVGDSAVKFTALNEDPCGRVDILAGVTWTRTPASPTASPEGS